MTTETTRRSRVLIVTGDVLGTKMAGPAIRAWEMAKVLHRVCDVRLVTTQSCTLTQTEFPVSVATRDTMRAHVSWCEVLVFQGHTLESFPWISRSNAIIVADIYDPMHLEYLEQGKDAAPTVRAKQGKHIVGVLNTQLRVADYLLCASEKQRDFWLGQLAAVNRLNAKNYDRDPSLRALIDVAPFGVSGTPATQTRHAIKGVVPGIDVDDQVLVWGGGIYNWFDPLTLIRAVALLAPTRPRLRLYFLGVTHPNPGVGAMRMASDALALADELKLTDRHVFFNTGWVDYEDRVNYLLDADLGVSTHFEHVETAFSFRTRMLDYLWAGLPMVSTEGDTFAALIREHQLGITVPPQDARALATAIESLLYRADRTAISARVRAFGSTMTWNQTLTALTEFCVAPSAAADRTGSKRFASTRMPSSNSIKRLLRPVTPNLSAVKRALFLRDITDRQQHPWMHQFAHRYVPAGVRRFVRRLIWRR